MQRIKGKLVKLNIYSAFFRSGTLNIAAFISLLKRMLFVIQT